MGRDAEEQRWLRRALREARKAAVRGEVPVGAVLVFEERLVAADGNAVERRSDPTEHAELRVIRRACRKLGNWRLNGADLYVTKEPCAMCAGAIALARVRRVVFGTPDPGAGACGSRYSIVQEGAQRHRVEVLGGVLADECAELLRGFFRERRIKT